MCGGPLQQHTALLTFRQVKSERPFVAHYRDAWPVKLLMCQFVNNNRGYRRQKIRKQAIRDDGPNTAGPSTATSHPTNPGNNNGEGGDGSGEESDVNISDIDVDN